ncbi:hypothetical protein [Herbaspirillum sp.]|uniref:hypothetical protein n=1 Tax=Herbaspirillum sp. TaxID=1890675 RepID=UPI0025878054|nr:hypothetical protein [Herbaspirillum sp.]MCP3947350.1 hypothetical protein [Herbaspirillum sp.]
MDKYFKPRSLTWWTSLAPILVGVFMALEPVHGMTAAVAFLYNATGVTAPVLINAGLVGIGVRGAMGQ